MTEVLCPRKDSQRSLYWVGRAEEGGSYHKHYILWNLELGTLHFTG